MEIFYILMIGISEYGLRAVELNLSNSLRQLTSVATSMKKNEKHLDSRGLVLIQIDGLAGFHPTPATECQGEKTPGTDVGGESRYPAGAGRRRVRPGNRMEPIR